MKSIELLLMLGLCMLTAPASAATKSETFTYKHDGVVLEGYLAWDDAVAGKRPGVLVVHEWMGLNDYARMRANMLAELGYAALAVDVYGKGVRPASVQDAAAESARYKNDRPLLRGRMLAGLAALRGRAEVDPQRIAAIGYCFGGTAVLELARSGADVRGVVSFHGGLSSPAPSDAPSIKGEVLVLHGADDPFVPREEVNAFKDEMIAGGVTYQFIEYPGAVHGFTNPANKGILPGALYDADADAKSWQELKTFLAKVLSAK